MEVGADAVEQELEDGERRVVDAQLLRLVAQRVTNLLKLVRFVQIRHLGGAKIQRGTNKEITNTFCESLFIPNTSSGLQKRTTLTLKFGQDFMRDLTTCIECNV